ncbi:hypothetical protein BARVI_04150 [Barnesiella viscericola DSM 18177]|uniref:Uncharacterized protein n=1 Tax=Barnesiella viscericola DSM 18177 TaxID=880074 RepID=W0EX98_9BACT|nr:hypothetical protein BARVI_04150 [Barnesiella viscericola DSM 18177]
MYIYIPVFFLTFEAFLNKTEIFVFEYYYHIGLI